MLSPRETNRGAGERPRRLVNRLLCGVALVASVATASPASAALPGFNLQLSTSKGCFETGQNPVFMVGENVTVFFRIGSGAVPKASTTLFDVLPNGFVKVFGFGQLSTNVTYAFHSKIAPPTGIERLILRASAMGVQTTQRSCSFRVVDGTPKPTRTPTATPTPTDTPPTRTPTTSPPTGMTGTIRTNRGCIEDGDNPIFAVGDAIVVSFRVNSTTMFQTKVSVADILANGFVKVFGFGVLQTNVIYAFSAGIAPPTGTETVELRAGFSFPQTVLDRCSFTVVGSPHMTPSRTRTRTRTRTPTPISTSTPTPTATPTS